MTEPRTGRLFSDPQATRGFYRHQAVSGLMTLLIAVGIALWNGAWYWRPATAGLAVTVLSILAFALNGLVIVLVIRPTAEELSAARQRQRAVTPMIVTGLVSVGLAVAVMAGTGGFFWLPIGYAVMLLLLVVAPQAYYLPRVKRMAEQARRERAEP